MKRLLGIFLTIAMVLSLTACSAEQASDFITNLLGTEGKSATLESTVSVQGGTIKQLKETFGTADALAIKPFYNVEENTAFTFHFNSYVNPFTAVTVHTDSACQMDSMVYQFNSGYATGSGMDVVVSPYRAVLQHPDASDELQTGSWGNAPIYYLSINYDLYSATPQKLNKPLVVPFTIKSEVSTPNIEGHVTDDGVFTIRWKPVTDAVKYNLYSSLVDTDTNMTRAQLGFSGDSLKLLGSVDATDEDGYISVSRFFSDSGMYGEGNTLESEGYIIYQNAASLNTYYVTAVDANGNESHFSLPVQYGSFTSRLPYGFDSYMGLPETDVEGIGYVLTKLPSVVPITLANGERAMYPIRYVKLNEKENTAIYRYEIEHTLLAREVEVYFEDGNYPEVIESDDMLDTVSYEAEVDILKIPEVSVPTISDSDYSNSVVDLTKNGTRSKGGLISYTQELALIRADIESARLINDGHYGDNNPFTILYDNPKLIAYMDKNGNRIKTETVLGTTKDITTDGGVGTGDTVTSIVVDDEVVYDESETTKEETEPVTDEKAISRNDYENHEIPNTITNDNLVAEQLISTEKQVAEADTKRLYGTRYMVFADSAEEAYLASAMMNAEESIDVTAFPILQNCAYLVDAFQKVVYQNPYILGVTGLSYDPETRIVSVEYALSKEDILAQQQEIHAEANSIYNTLINSEMDAEAAVNAFWNYFEENTKYDTETLEAAQQAEFGNSVLNTHPDAFSTYGIMCKKVGVCQSYAMSMKLLCAYAGINSKVLTGYIATNLPHAWNAIELGDSWYWLDATNNKTNMGIPYYLYLSSSTCAAYCGYVLDDLYDLDSNLAYVINTDNSKDYYAKNDMMFDELPEAIGKLSLEFSRSRETTAVKCLFDFELTQDVVSQVGEAVYGAGVSMEDVETLRLIAYNGILAVIPQQ